MKTQKPAKRSSKKFQEEYFDHDEYQRKAKVKKPRRGRRDPFTNEYDDDRYDDDSY